MARKAAYQLDFGLLILDPDAHRQQQQCKPRRCLSCDSAFASTGPGHRICDACKALDGWKSGVSDFSVSCAF
jgi:hypothetical protein